MAWKRGPVPKDTLGWGGVTKVGDTSMGFYFAQFEGSRVILFGNPPNAGEVVPANGVAWYDNSLTLPPPGTPEDYPPVAIGTEGKIKFREFL